ncbi:MAG: MarR family winged helix-turn-helix transcriptional regulator [Exilibacterium sp.]
MPKTSIKPASVPKRDSANPRPLDDHIGHLLRRAHQYASANLSSKLKEYGLSPAQHAVLLRLFEVRRVSQNELGRLVAMERANIHSIVNRLLAQGLIVAKKDGRDARKNVICLSGKGRRLVKTLAPLHNEATAQVLSVLSKVEIEQLYSLLQRICPPPE